MKHLEELDKSLDLEYTIRVHYFSILYLGSLCKNLFVTRTIIYGSDIVKTYFFY